MGRNIIAAGIDFSGISNDIQKLKTETSNIKFDKTFEKRIEKVENEVSGLNSKLSDAIKKLETLSDLTGVNPKAVETFAKMGDEITNLQQQMKGVTDQLKVFADAAAATGDVSKLVQISGLNSELTKAGGNMTALATGVEKATKGFTKSITTVKEFADKLEEAIPNKSKDLKGMANALKIEDDAKRSKKVIEQLKNDLKLLADQTNEYNNLNQGNLDTQSIEQHKELLKIDEKRIRTLQKIRDELDMIHLSDVLDDKGNDLWLKNFGKDFNKIISVLTNETKGLFAEIINPEDLAAGIEDAFNKIRVNTVSRSTELFKQIERASKEGLLLEDKKSRDKTNKRIKEEAEEAKAQTSMSFKAGSDEVVMEQLVEVLTNLQKYADSHAIKLDVQINPSWGSKRTNQYLQSMKKTLEKAGKRKDVSEEFAKLGNIQDALGEDFASALVKGMEKVKSTLSEGLEIGKITLGEDALTGLQEEINKKGKELDLSIGKATQENIKEQTSTIDNADIKINTATINIDNGNFNGNFSLPPSSGVPSPSTSEEAKVQEKATENAVESQKVAKETVAEAKKTSEKMSKTQIDTLRKVNDILTNQRRFDDVESAKQYINANKGNIKNAYNTLMGKPENNAEYTQAAKDIENMMAAIRVVMPKSDAKTKAELANIVNMKNDVTKHVSDVLNKVKTTAKEKVSEIGNEVVSEIKRQTEKVAKETKKATKKQTQPEKLKVGETLDKDGNVKNVELTIDQMRKNITGALDSYGNMVNAVSDSAKTLYNPEVTGSDEEIRQAYMKYYKVQERLKAAINESKKKGSSVTEEDLRGIKQGVANLAQDVMNLFRIRDSIANGTRFNSDSEYLIQTAGRLGGKGGIKATSDEGKRVINEVAKAVLRGEKIKTDADVPVDVGELGQNKTVKSAIERQINAINKEIESENKLKEKTDKLARKREEQAEAVADKAAKKTAVADKKAIEEDVAKIKRNSKARETAKPTTQSQKKVSQSVQKEAEEYVNKKIASIEETNSFVDEINKKINSTIKKYNKYDKKYNTSGQFGSSKEGIEKAVATARRNVSAAADLRSAYNELSWLDKQKVGSLSQYIDKARIQQIAMFLSEISRIEAEIESLPKGSNVEGIKDYYEKLIYNYTAVSELLEEVQYKQNPNARVRNKVSAYEAQAKEEAEYYQERVAEEAVIEDYLNGNLKFVEENNQTIKETKENVQKTEAETKESNEALEKVNKSVQKTTNGFEELKENLLRMQEIAEYGLNNGFIEDDHNAEMADLYANVNNAIDKLPKETRSGLKQYFNDPFEEANEALMSQDFDTAYDRLERSVAIFEEVGKQIDINIANGIKQSSGVVEDALQSLPEYFSMEDIIGDKYNSKQSKEKLIQNLIDDFGYAPYEHSLKFDSENVALLNTLAKGTINSVHSIWDDKARKDVHNHPFKGHTDSLMASLSDLLSDFATMAYYLKTGNTGSLEQSFITSGNEAIEFDYSESKIKNVNDIYKLQREIQRLYRAADYIFKTKKDQEGHIVSFGNDSLVDSQKMNVYIDYVRTLVFELLKEYGINMRTYGTNNGKLKNTTNSRILSTNKLNSKVVNAIKKKSMSGRPSWTFLDEEELSEEDLYGEIGSYEKLFEIDKKRQVEIEKAENKIKELIKEGQSLNKILREALNFRDITGSDLSFDFLDSVLDKNVIDKIKTNYDTTLKFYAALRDFKNKTTDAYDFGKQLGKITEERNEVGLPSVDINKLIKNHKIDENTSLAIKNGFRYYGYSSNQSNIEDEILQEVLDQINQSETQELSKRIKNKLKSAKVSKDNLNTKETQNAIAQAAAMGYGQVTDFNDLKLGYGKDVISRLNAELESYTAFKKIVQRINEAVNSGKPVKANNIAKELTKFNKSREQNGLAQYMFSEKHLGVNDDLYKQIILEYAKQTMEANQKEIEALSQERNETIKEIDRLTKEQDKDKPLISRTKNGKLMAEYADGTIVIGKESIEGENKLRAREAEKKQASKNKLTKAQKALGQEMVSYILKGEWDKALNRWDSYKSNYNAYGYPKKAGTKTLEELTEGNLVQDELDKFNELWTQRNKKQVQQNQKTDEAISSETKAVQATDELTKTTKELTEERKKETSKAKENISTTKEQTQKKPQKGIAADMQVLLDKGDISGAVDRWRTYETHGGKKKFNELGLDVEQSVKDKMNALYKERYMKVQQQTQKAEEEVATQNAVTSANEELAKATNDLADERKKAATKEAETVTDIHDQLANARKFFGGKDTNKYGKLLEDSIEIKNGTAHAIFQNEDGGYATLSAKTKNGIDFKDSGIEFGISSLVKKYVNSLKKEIDEAQVVSQKVLNDIDAGNIPAALRNKIASIAEPIKEITEEYRRDKQGHHYLSYKVDYDRGGFDIFGANGTLLKSGSPVGEVDRIIESIRALKAESKDLPEIIGKVAAGTATDEEIQRLKIMEERYRAIGDQITNAQQRLQGFGRLSETLDNYWYNLTNGNSLSMNEFLGDFTTGTTEAIQKRLVSLNDSDKGATPEYQKQLLEANELIDKIKEKIRVHDINNPWDFDRDRDELKEIFEYIQKIQGITGKLNLKESTLVPTGEVDKLIGKLKGTNFEKLALPFNQKKQMQDMIDYLEKVKEGGTEAAQALEAAFGIRIDPKSLSQLDASQFKKIAEAVNGMTAATKGVDEGFFSRFGSRLKSTNMQFITMMFSFYDWIRYARQALSVVQEFDKALTTISFTMNTTTKQLNGMAQQSIDMAKELGTTTDQVLSVAQIYANMQSSSEEIMERAKPTVMLSTASGLDTSTVSDYLQAVENEFEMSASDAEHIADVYESISANIAMDFGKGIGVIAEGTQVSGQLAHEAGMSFEQFAAIIAKTAETTRQSGSVIGNAWKTIISRLTKSGSMSEEVDPETLSASAQSLAAIGIQVYDNMGKFRELETILGELSAKWDSLSDAQQANIAYNVAGK